MELNPDHQPSDFEERAAEIISKIWTKCKINFDENDPILGLAILIELFKNDLINTNKELNSAFLNTIQNKLMDFGNTANDINQKLTDSTIQNSIKNIVALASVQGELIERLSAQNEIVLKSNRITRIISMACLATIAILSSAIFYLVLRR